MANENVPILFFVQGTIYFSPFLILFKNTTSISIKTRNKIGLAIKDFTIRWDITVMSAHLEGTSEQRLYSRYHNLFYGLSFEAGVKKYRCGVF